MKAPIYDSILDNLQKGETEMEVCLGGQDMQRPTTQLLCITRAKIELWSTGLVESMLETCATRISTAAATTMKLITTIKMLLTKDLRLFLQLRLSLEMTFLVYISFCNKRHYAGRRKEKTLWCVSTLNYVCHPDAGTLFEQSHLGVTLLLYNSIPNSSAVWYF